MAEHLTSSAPDGLALATALRRNASQLNRKLRPYMKLEGLPLAKLSALGHLVHRHTMTPTELATLEGVKVQTLTRLLAELEADGWIQRQAHPQDGRQTQLRLTKQGQHKLAQGGNAADTHLAQLLAQACSASERAVLQQACTILGRLVDGI